MLLRIIMNNNIVKIAKYREAGFNTLWNVNEKWIAGFFCQGKESELNDGLITYLPLEGYSEARRISYLSPVCETAQEAIDKAYNLWKENENKNCYK